ncbi:hypothetical protein KIN20_029972 [Parelaphostrongylus tenuis]|uniref:Uncharacterized protein n=1 Tax=Parelaphostrongylus tenuis TaxID=148309 RepID=A0AAD5R408_PARTN|nr:hypothetical protein KIN20_029972 [Parelaphostrongylus tenuis]
MNPELKLEFGDKQGVYKKLTSSCSECNLDVFVVNNSHAGRRFGKTPSLPLRNHEPARKVREMIEIQEIL